MQTLAALGKPNPNHPNRASHTVWSLETPSRTGFSISPTESKTEPNFPATKCIRPQPLSDILWVSRKRE